MSLPVVTGKGFLLSDGIDLKYAQSGAAWARLPLSFQNRRKDDNGNWTHDKQIVVEATVFGALAEFLSQEIAGRQEIAVSGELYTESYAGKDGEKKTSIRMNVHSATPAGKPREKATANKGFAADEVPF